MGNLKGLINTSTVYRAECGFYIPQHVKYKYILAFTNYTWMEFIYTPTIPSDAFFFFQPKYLLSQKTIQIYFILEIQKMEIGGK